MSTDFVFQDLLLSHNMFVVRVSYIPILQEVVSHCRLPYVSAIREVTEDDMPLFGIELELPHLFEGDLPRRLFSWPSQDVTASDPFHAAALQALQFLQGIYHFTILHYNSHQLALCSRLARHVFSVANAGAQLARLVLSESAAGTSSSLSIVSAAQSLLEEVDSMASPF